MEPVIFRDPLNARDYATALNLLLALYNYLTDDNANQRICDPGHCEHIFCKTMHATDAFLNHRTGG